MEFEKKFVHCTWDDSLVGKLCVFADDIPDLKQRVERCDSNHIAVLQVPDYSTDMDALAYPFHKYINANKGYRFVYYDTNLECKIAHEQGKQIQFRTHDGKWEDVTEKPLWHEGIEYRVKPLWHEDIEYHVKPEPEHASDADWKSDSDTITVEFKGTEAECDAWIAEHTSKTRRMTNKELARWHAEGNGERLDVVTKYVFVHYVYTEGCDDEACDEDIRIREWGSNEWHEPLVEVTE